MNPEDHRPNDDIDQEAPPPSAADRLRALQQKLFQPHDFLGDEPQRGHGSKWQKLKPEERTHHDALEALVAAEQAVSDAQNKLTEAEANLKDAEAKAEAAAV